MQGFFNHLAQPVIHGRILVESALEYIASARRGLSENEILEILWDDPEYKPYFEAQTKKTKPTTTIPGIYACGRREW